MVLRDTSFYAEAGGQVADTGAIEGPDSSSFTVEDVQVNKGHKPHHQSEAGL